MEWFSIKRRIYQVTKRNIQQGEVVRPSFLFIKIQNLKSTMKHLFALFFALLLFSHLAEAQLVFPVKQDGKWGLIDKKGEIFLSPTYDAIGKMDAFGYAIIQTKDKIGIINQNGQVVLSPRFQGVKVIDNGLFAV